MFYNLGASLIQVRPFGWFSNVKFLAVYCEVSFSSWIAHIVDPNQPTKEFSCSRLHCISLLFSFDCERTCIIEDISLVDAQKVQE